MADRYTYALVRMSRTRKVRLMERRDEASAETVDSYDESHAWTWTRASWIDSADRTGPALALMSTWTSRSRSPVLSGTPAAARSDAAATSASAASSTGVAASSKGA